MKTQFSQTYLEKLKKWEESLDSFYCEKFMQSFEYAYLAMVFENARLREENENLKKKLKKIRSVL